MAYNVALCLVCPYCEEFDPQAGRGRCHGWGKKQIEAKALDMIVTAESPNLDDALSRTGPWKWPITMWDEGCSQNPLNPPVAT